LTFLHSQHGHEPPNCKRLKCGIVPKIKPPVKEPPEVELKPSPSNFKYVFINPPSSLPTMIAICLHETKEEKLLWIFRDKKGNFGWNIHDMKGLNPTLCTHKINAKEGSPPKQSSQRKLIPNMMEFVKKKDIMSTIKMKAYHERFQQMQTIMHPSDLLANHHMSNS